MTEVIRYSTMLNSNGALFHLMSEVETNVADGILKWIDKSPHTRFTYTNALKRIPYDSDYVSTIATQDIAVNLWADMHAAQWLHPGDAGSPHCWLWRVAIVRAGRLLNTGSFNFSFEQDPVEYGTWDGS